MVRTTLLLTFLSLTLLSCEQDNNQPDPTPTMTTTEQSLVGKWYWDSTQVYNAGAYTATYNHANPYNTLNCAGCYMDFKTSFWNGTTNTPYQPQYYDNVWDKSMCSQLMGSGTGFWQILPPGTGGNGTNLNKLFVNGTPGVIGYIRNVTATNLVVSEWGGDTPQGVEVYYHK